MIAHCDVHETSCIKESGLWLLPIDSEAHGAAKQCNFLDKSVHAQELVRRPQLPMFTVDPPGDLAITKARGRALAQNVARAPGTVFCAVCAPVYCCANDLTSRADHSGWSSHQSH